MSKFSDWIPAAALPVRVGVYETQTEIEATADDGCGGPWFNYWDGKRWFMTGNNPLSAHDRSHGKHKQLTVVDVYQWRGLTEPSNV